MQLLVSIRISIYAIYSPQRSCVIWCFSYFVLPKKKTELDPKNYLTYFKRGTVYLALGKARPALADLTLVLQLKPDFIAARYDGNTNRTTTKTYTIRK